MQSLNGMILRRKRSILPHGGIWHAFCPCGHGPSGARSAGACKRQPHPTEAEGHEQRPTRTPQPAGVEPPGDPRAAFHLDRLFHQFLRVVQPRAAAQHDPAVAGADRAGAEDAPHSQRGAHHPGAHRHRHAGGQVRPAAGLFGPAHYRRVHLHRLCLQHRFRAGRHPAFPAGLHRRRLRHRHPHDLRVVPGEDRRPGGGHLRWLGQLRLGRRGHDPAHHRAPVRRRGRLALGHRALRRHRHPLWRVLLLRRVQHAQGLHLFPAEEDRRAGGNIPARFLAGRRRPARWR